MPSNPQKPHEGSLPNDMEAEQAVLGSLLIDVRAIERVAALIRPEDFYLTVNGEIYRGMLTLYGQDQPTDTVIVANYLQAQDRLDALGGLSYLASLSAMVPTSINAEYYARIVKRLSTLRQMVDAGLRIASIGYDERLESSEAMAEAEKILLDLASSGLIAVPDDKGDVLNRIYDRLTGSAADDDTLIQTGFPGSIDRYLGGLLRGGLIVLAARPGVGKTSLLCGMAHNIAMRFGRNGLIFSVEMGRDQIYEKMACVGSFLTWKQMHSHDLMPTEKVELRRALDRIDGSPIEIIDAAGMPVEQMMSEAWERHRKRPLDLIGIDYLQIARASERRENRVQEVTYLSSSMKLMARKLDCPVFALSQLNRAVEGRADGRPVLSDLRESGSIEQDADAVIFLSRVAQDEQRDVYPVLLDVAKNRFGPEGTAEMMFNGPQMKFADAAHEDQRGNITPFRKAGNDVPF